MRIDGEHRIAAGGVDHWVRIAGSSSSDVPLVVVHGGPGSNAYSLEPIGDLLAETTPVIVYDQRGCGRSGRPDSAASYTFPRLVQDLDELRDALGYERIIPWGHSFGASLAAEYAVAHPDRVHRLILAGPPIAGPLHPGAFALQPAAMDAHATPEIRTALRAALSDVPDPVQRMIAGAGTLDPATRERFVYHGPKPAPDHDGRTKPTAPVNMEMALLLLAAMRTGLADDLAETGIATLVMVGLWDGNVGVDVARDLAVRLPRAELRLFLRSGHAPHEEEPAEYAAALRAFLSG